jgi:elongation factor P
LLASLNDEDLVIHNTVQALDELQRLRVKAGLHRLHILDRRVAARAEKVGLKTCVKPGKGGAFVRTKLKSLDAGAVVDRTFRAGEKFPRVHTETKNVQYLYDDGSEVHFMDTESYEQFALPHADLADELPYMQPNASVQVLSVNGKPSSLQLPASVELAVAETEPGVKGDTVSNVTKSATLETGAIVQVPMFVNVGDRLKVDPREGRYISRA